MDFVIVFFQIAGSLGLFLYGMKLLSEGLQKAAGDRMKRILNFMTGNHFVAVITGILVTVIIQSSSATTVMVVSFVNAGLISLSASIGVILGANIGTTITGWIVALLGFKMDISILALFSIAFSIPMMFSKKMKYRDVADIFLGFGILFLGINFMKNSMPDISSNVGVLSFLNTLNSGSIFTIIICVLIGVVLTVLVQSSSTTMAITLTLAYQGWLGVNMACALVIGQNIGTTITAYLASLGASTNAKRSAWAHIIFNVTGSILAVVFFKPLMNLVNRMTPKDIFTLSGTALASSLPFYLALFHTTFNIINTLLFFPFIDKYARFIERFIPDTQIYDDNTYHFTYVGAAFMDTPELYMIAIRDETKKMANLAAQMFAKYRETFNKNDIEIDEYITWFRQKEEFADQMQEQLSSFCVKLIQDTQTPTNAAVLNSIIRVLDEIESITDSCLNLIILTKRRISQGWSFTDESAKDLISYQMLVQSFLDFICLHMNQSLSNEQMAEANDYESQIDGWRNILTSEVQSRLTQEEAEVKQELVVLEKIRHLEHIGDYCINIAEAYTQAIKHTPVLQRVKKEKLAR